MINKQYINICNSLIMNDEVFYKKIGDNIELYSYGCPPSIWDLETIAYCIDQNKLNKKVVFIDTCCAIGIQEDISKRVVDRITSIYSDRIIYITGCGISYNKKYYEGKGILLDNNEKFDFKNSYSNIIKKDVNPLDSNHINGFVKIIDGCKYNCSYCSIRNVRPHRMFSYEEISQQIKKNIENNVYDIFLFGTEICSYYYNGLNLTGLIEKIIKDFPEISSVKLDTLNPGFKDIDNLINLIKQEDKMPKELDLGIQSCSDTILKLMRRPYTVKDIKHIVKIGRNLDISFQMIVGFPGETDEIFNESLTNLKELSPNRITLCPFSERKNTDAQEMNNKIPYEIAKQREEQLALTVKQNSNQDIEKKNIVEFNNFKPISTDNCCIFHVDLYDKKQFIKLFQELNELNTDKEILVYCDFTPEKNIKDLSINIKLLIITFGAKVITKFKINDETIKYNFPRLLTTDILTFIEFEFEKLKSCTKEDLITFIKDVTECNIDCKRLVTRMSEAGNRDLIKKVLDKL